MGDLDAACRSVRDEDDVALPIDRAEIGDFPVIGPQDRGIELQLFGDVRGPSFGEALPDEDGDRPDAQAAPHRGFEGPGVRSGQDADQEMLRDPEDPSCFLYGAEQFFLSQGGAVGTPDRGILQRIEVPSRSLAAGTGGEMGIVHERLLIVK